MPYTNERAKRASFQFKILFKALRIINNLEEITRFLTQPEPVLSEPGLKNPQASKIKKRILLPLKVNRFQNKPQASKIRPLQKVGFLGNNGKIFVLDLFF